MMGNYLSDFSQILLIRELVSWGLSKSMYAELIFAKLCLWNVRYPILRISRILYTTNLNDIILQGRWYSSEFFGELSTC